MVGGATFSIAPGGGPLPSHFLLIINHHSCFQATCTPVICFYFPFPGCRCWSGDQWCWGSAGNPLLRLLYSSVPIPSSTFAGAWSLESQAAGLGHPVFLLQEHCPVHHGGITHSQHIMEVLHTHNTLWRYSTLTTHYGGIPHSQHVLYIYHTLCYEFTDLQCREVMYRMTNNKLVKFIN